MAAREPHRALLIPEIMEMILEKVDVYTLLTKAQRVCHQWRAIIRGSHNIQVKLFLKPSRAPHIPGQQRKENPFFGSKIWTDHFYHGDLIGSASEDQISPPGPPKQENTHLRPEASWRRMVHHQPPTYQIAVIEGYVNRECRPYITRMTLTNDDFLRFETLGKGIKNGICLPEWEWDGRNMWYWLDNFDWNLTEMMGEDWWKKMSYLKDCDAIFVLDQSLWLDGGSERNSFDEWLLSLGAVIQADYPVRCDPRIQK